MNQKILKRLFSGLLSFTMIIGATMTTAMASNANVNLDTNIKNSDNRYEIVIKTEKVSMTRGTTQTIAQTIDYVDTANNKTVCSFILYGVFDTSTRKCVNAYGVPKEYDSSWHVENIQVSRDTYTASCSVNFVKRWLGIKIYSEQIGAHVKL